MQAHLTHMQFNVQPEHMPFYKDLLAFVGWQSLYDSAEMIGVADKNGVSLWFAGQAGNCSDHRGRHSVFDNQLQNIHYARPQRHANSNLLLALGH